MVHGRRYDRYGEGDPTDNAIEFTTWLKDKGGELEDNLLAGTAYCVFGLGNTQVTTT